MTTQSAKGVPEEIGCGRVEALSDGVFAIVVTLLVLEIKVPHIEIHHSLPQLAGALLALASKFVSWAIRFLTVCVIWLQPPSPLQADEQNRQRHLLVECEPPALDILHSIPQALMGDYPSNRLAVSFYGSVMFMMALGFVLIRAHMHRGPYLIRTAWWISPSFAPVRSMPSHSDRLPTLSELGLPGQM
jgi:hypothetical protein